MSQILKGVKEGSLSARRPESALISAKNAEIRQIEPFAVRFAIQNLDAITPRRN